MTSDWYIVRCWGGGGGFRADSKRRLLDHSIEVQVSETQNLPIPHHQGILGQKKHHVSQKVLCKGCRSYFSPGWYHQNLGLRLQYQFPPGPQRRRSRLTGTGQYCIIVRTDCFHLCADAPMISDHDVNIEPFARTYSPFVMEDKLSV